MISAYVDGRAQIHMVLKLIPSIYSVQTYDFTRVHISYLVEYA